MNQLTNNGWRLALVASGITLALGGSMHPESDAREPLREELAEMTSDPDWWLSHGLVVISTVLLAAGLWLAVRRQGWPERVGRPLRFAAIAVSAYVVESVFHFGAAIDSDALRDGGAAPVAFMHIGLSMLLYPLTGAAIALLGARTFGAFTPLRKPIALIAVAAGLAQATVIPLTLALPNTELSPVFAGSAVLLALWSVLTAFAGFGTPAMNSPSTASEVRITTRHVDTATSGAAPR
jgi:hypothetical protein